MMDRFREDVVVKKGRVLDEIMYYLSAVIMVLAALIAMFEINIVLSSIGSGEFYALGLVVFLLNAAVAVLLFFFRDRLRTEYEYTFTNGTLDFAQVYNNKKRKSLGSLKVNNVDAFGKVSSGSFHRYISMQGVKQSRWFLNRGADLYYFFFQKDGNKRIIIFEPQPEMVEYIEAYLPFGAKQEN
ncbi:MAG: hypothetical protein IJ708_14190 [Clostridia bacterium]|nr:hypothetical protein [Clostridia bacterium]